MKAVQNVDLATARVDVGPLTTFPLVPPIEGSMFFDEVGRAKQHPLSRATCISPASPSEYYGLWDHSKMGGVSPTSFPTSLLQNTPFLTSQKATAVPPPCGTFDDRVVIPVGLTEHFGADSPRPLRVHHKDPMLRLDRSNPTKLVKAIERNYLTIVTPVIEGTPANLSFDATGRSVGASLVEEVSKCSNVREIRVLPPTSGDCHHGTMIQQIYDVVADHCSSALQAACVGDKGSEGTTFVVTGLDAIEAFVDVLDEFHMVLWALSSLLTHYSTHETTSIVTPEGNTVLRTYLGDQAASEIAALGEQRLEEQRVAKKKGLPPTSIHQQSHIAAMEDALSQPSLHTPFDVLHSVSNGWFVRVVVLLPPHLCSYPSALTQHVSRLLGLGVASVDWPVLHPTDSVDNGSMNINRQDISVVPTDSITTSNGSIDTSCINDIIDATVDYMVSLHNRHYDDNISTNITHVVPVFVPDSDVASRLCIAIDDQYTSEPINVVLGFGDDSSLLLSHPNANASGPSLIFIVCLSGVIPSIRHGSFPTTLSAATRCVESEGLSIGISMQDRPFQLSLEGTVVHMGLTHYYSKTTSMGTNNTIWEVLSVCKLLSATTGRTLTVVIPTVLTYLSDFNQIKHVLDDQKVLGPRGARSVSRVSKCILEVCRRFRCSDVQQSMGVSLSNTFYKDHVLASEQRHKLRANRRLQRQRESENGVSGDAAVSDDDDDGDGGRCDNTIYQQVLPKDVDPQSQIFLSLRLLSGPSEGTSFTDALHYLIHGDFVVPTHVISGGAGVSVSLILSVLGQRIGGALLPQKSTSCISPNLSYLKYALCASAIGVPEYHITSKVRSVRSECPWESDEDVWNVLVSFLEVLLRIPFRSVQLDPSMLDSRTSIMDELCQQWARYPNGCTVTGAQFLLSPFVRRERLVPPKLLLGGSIGTQVPCRGWYTESAPVVVPEAVLNRDGEYLSLDQDATVTKGDDTNLAQADQNSIMAAIIQRNITSLSTAQIVTESKKSTRQKRGRRVEATNDAVDRVASVATPLGLSQELDLTKPGMGYMKPLTAIARFPSVLSEVVKISIVDPLSELVSTAPSSTVTIPAASLDLCLVVKAVLRNALFNTCVVLDGPAVLPFTGCSAAMGDTANALIASITSTLRGFRSDDTASTSSEDFEKKLTDMISSTLFPTVDVGTTSLRPNGPLSVYQLPKSLSQSSTFTTVLSALVFPSDSQSSIWADSLSSVFDEMTEVSVVSSHLAVSRDNMLHTSSGLPSLSGVCAHTQFRSLDVAQSVKRMKNPPPSSTVNDATSNNGSERFSGPTPEKGEDRIIDKVIQSIKKIGRAKVERASMGKPLFGFLDPAHSLHPYYLNALKEQGIYE